MFLLIKSDKKKKERLQNKRGKKMEHDNTKKQEENEPGGIRTPDLQLSSASANSLAATTGITPEIIIGH